MTTNKANGVISHEISNIARWYENRSIFITGATGFMGKVLVEKLLSSCPGITKIYLLLRRKKDVSPEKRLDQMKQTPIFDYLKKYYPQRLDKLVVISGDVLEPDLGISNEDQNTLASTVSVVFHSAATVRFDDPIQISVAMNIIGTQRLLKLCHKMSKLEALIHVSTAYCNCDLKNIEEKIYPSPGDIDKTLQIINCLDTESLNMMTPRLIGNRPNTYTFTKAMAESILVKEGSGLPIVIIRPSIVTASIKWPMPGWVDNLNGPTGILAGAGKGILRTLYCQRKMRGDIIPVDICINAFIAAAWNKATEKSEDLKVYNVSTGTLNPIYWGQIEVWSRDEMITNPCEDVMWYPGGTFKSNYLLNKACRIIFHMVPAYIVDFSALFSGKKPAGSLVKVQIKIQKAVEALEYFTNNEWNFQSDNLQKLHTKLSEADKKVFDLDVTKIQWKPYIQQYFHGVRKYILKEDDRNMPKSKQHLRRMMIVHYTTKTLVILGILRFILGRSEMIRNLSFGLISYVVQLLRRLTQMALNR